MGRRHHGNLTSLFGVVLSAFTLLACAPSAAQLSVESVSRARNEAHQQHGPRQAVGYAEAVHHAHQAGGYQEDPKRLERDARDALSSIETVLQSAGADQPALWAWKGVLLADMGNGTESVQAFERSMALGPNLIAANHLLPIYGRANPPTGVGRVCSSTVPVVLDADERFALIESCKHATNAATESAALAWATPETIAWYRQQKQERAARIDAEIQEQAARQAYEQQVVRRAEICSAQCKEDVLRCQNRCPHDDACDQRCVGINRACLDQCDSQAHLELGQ